MALQKFSDELELFKKYLRSTDNEDARRPLLYPLFKKLFGDKMKIESAACGADVYVDGQLIVEAKTDFSQWLEGFYQALHYQKKHGLGYHTVMVIANEFIGIWKLNKLPEYVTILSKTSDPHKAPNEIGKVNAKKTSPQIKRQIQEAAFYWLTPKDLLGDIFAGAKNITTESYEILKILKNIDSDRQIIGTHNFINSIERMKTMFATPIEAVHAFYSIIYFWDITSKVSTSESGNEVRVLGYNGNKFSEAVSIHPHKVEGFKRFVESQYIFTNEGSGLTVDYYFSRFDEVLATIAPDYVKQHGIFFTEGNLSKFALWFAMQHFPGNIHEDYIVFDPAAGSGNLVSSWRGKLKHKIVSELQADLLRTIERRMQADPYHTETGFTIIPKTTDGIGLNFLDKDAATYMQILQTELQRKNIGLEKPLCFLLNPPYKNTDENQKERDSTDAAYSIHPSILQHTGEDAGKERYLGFLSQILNISKWHSDNQKMPKSVGVQNPPLGGRGAVVMIFTPTSWLIPRPTYKAFRKIWDNHFKFHSGFIITSNEFFKLQGRWPLAFTIWIYDESEKQNDINLYDLTEWKKANLNSILWDNKDKEKEIDKELNKALEKSNLIEMNKNRVEIKKCLTQKMYDFKRDPTKQELESKEIYGGLPIKDERRNNKKTYGISGSSFIGFMDDCTPCRIKNDSDNRMSNKPDRIWFYLDNRIQQVNLLKCFNGPTDNRSYCAYDLESSKNIFSWFCIGKSIVGVYPLWANMLDLWQPTILKEKEAEWYALCFAFVLAENRCVVTKFEKDNPIKDAPEVFVDNPLCPTNKESFWATTLQPFINEQKLDSENAAILLINQITELYKYWNYHYCKGQYLYNNGLHTEPYFKYFNYPDFLTPYSGLIQIKKYAELQGDAELLDRFSAISSLSKAVKQQLYNLLVKDFGYFE
jgi:hypothetical protein